MEQLFETVDGEVKPKRKSRNSAEREIENLKKQCDDFEKEIKDLTQDISAAPKAEESEPQTKLSNQDKERLGQTYLEPIRKVSSSDKFQEKFRSEYEYRKQYVCFIAENKEIIGEDIEIWTRPYGGMPAEFWRVPVNRPIWGPRYLAEQISNCKYQRMRMEQEMAAIEAQRMGFAGSISTPSWTGNIVVDSIHRLDANPYVEKKLFAMSSKF